MAPHKHFSTDTESFERIRECRIFCIFALSLLFGVILTTGCRREKHDPRLISIVRNIDTAPEKTLAALTALDTVDFCKSDRAFLNLHKVKAQDKASIPHSSDSIITLALEYYGRQYLDSFYTEALYLAGKVYLDLGDYPTALRHLHNLILNSPGTGQRITTQRNAFRLLNNIYLELGLIKESIPFLEETIKIDSLFYNPDNLIEDKIKMAEVCLELGKYSYADSCLSSASELLPYASTNHWHSIEATKAVTVHMQHNNNAALNIVRRFSADSIFNCDILSGHIPDIYLEAGMTDSAFLLAKKLTLSTTPKLKVKGYHTMLLPELRPFIPYDSLGVIMTEYKDALEKQTERDVLKGSLLQNAHFNYSIHDRNSRILMNENKSLRNLLICAVILAFGIILCSLMFQLYNKTKIIKLQSTVIDLKNLRESLADTPSSASDENTDYTNGNVYCNLSHQENFTGHKTQEELIRDELRAQYQEICKATQKNIQISPVIIKSEPYQQIQKYIQQGSLIPESNRQIWQELENTVIRSSRKFKTNLSLLIGEKISESDLRLALLIKCGISPSQAALVLGRSRSTISYRRAEMCAKLLGEDFSTKQMDAIIRIL